MQQDAHEFLNYLLNTISETLLEEKNAEKNGQLNDDKKKNGAIRRGTGSSTAEKREEDHRLISLF